MAETSTAEQQETEREAPMRYRPRGRVVRADEIKAWRTGEDYLKAAEREAERLRADAIEAFEQAKKAGFEEGRKEGAEAAARLLAETTRRADRHLAEADQQVVDLALAVVRQVLGEFDTGRLVSNAVRHALSRQRQSQHLTLHVAPDLVEALRTEIDAAFEPGLRHLITVEPDPRLEQDQCRLASEVGFVDLGIKAQLNAIHRGLIDGVKRESHA
ncbi:MAG: type III secretion system stator protein SctL [Pseudomonadota bacterium]